MAANPDTPFLGLRGSGDFATNERPENWREAILRLYPNGDMALTALTAVMKKERTSDAHFHWWEKALPTQRCELAGSGVYTDDTLATAALDSTSYASGTTVYLSVTAGEEVNFRIGHQVLLRNGDVSGSYAAPDYRADLVGRVSGVASGRVDVVLLETSNAGAVYGIYYVDTVLIIGNINPEGGNIPDAIVYKPTERENVCQIWNNALDITRTARLTTLRTADAYKEAKRDTLELHGIEMEKSLIHSVYTVGIGANGKPERTTQGLLDAIRTYASTNVDAYHLNTNYSGQTWLEGGDDWMDKYFAQIFRYGKDEKMGFIGSEGLRAINTLAKFHGNYDISAQTVAWGIKVMQWVTPFGILYFKRHPLFSYEPTTRNSLVVFEPGNFIWRYVSDTFFKPDTSEKEGGSPGKDGTTEAFLTEAGLEYHFMEGSGFLTGLGRDNAV